MEFLGSIVVWSFDLLFILGELAVEGIGYAGWVVYALVRHCLGGELLIYQVSAMGAEVLRTVKMDLQGGIDAKTVLPYLPVMELLRVVRMKDPAMDMTPTWKTIRG